MERGKQIKLYHITDREAVKPILEHGLKGGTYPRNRIDHAGLPVKFNQPSIFALSSDENWICERVASNEIWSNLDIEGYAVIEIDSAGITGPVEFDDVTDSTQPYQRRIVQDLIEPRFLKALGFRPFFAPGKQISELLACVGKRKWTRQQWEMMNKCWPHGGEPALQTQAEWEKAQGPESS